MIPADTTLEAARVQFAILRSIGLEGRARMLFELNEGLRATLETGVRYRHRDYNDEQVRFAVIRLMLGERLFHQVFAGIEVKP